MAGMTHPEWRLSLINKIRSCYSDYSHAEERLEAAVKSGNKDRINLWTVRKQSCCLLLQEAYSELPEVAAGPVDMDAVAFAKSLRDEAPPRTASA